MFIAVLSVHLPSPFFQRLDTNFIVRAATFIQFELDLGFAKGCREKFHSLRSIRVQLCTILRAVLLPLKGQKTWSFEPPVRLGFGSHRESTYWQIRISRGFLITDRKAGVCPTSSYLNATSSKMWVWRQVSECKLELTLDEVTAA